MAWTDPATWTVGELVLASKMNTHIRDNLNVLERGSDWRPNVGTGGGLGERWYWLGLGSEPTFNTDLVSFGTLRAYPFAVPDVSTIDRLAFEVTTAGGAGSRMRCGIYQATSETNLYPNALIVDGGEFVSDTTGVKAATVSNVLEPDVVYWAATLSGTSAPTCRTITAGMTGVRYLGAPSTLGVTIGKFITVALAYGALPATFTGGATVSTNTLTATVAVRYSA